MTAAGGLFDLTGRIALVTGGSRGLGVEMAEGLAEAGAALMLLARREQWLAPAVERLRGLGFRCEGTICNVAEPASVEAAVARTLEHYGHIDILINNAGVTWGAPAEDMSIEKWREVLDVDLTGAFLVSQAAGREMLRRGHGNIINVASVAGLRALPEAIHAAAYIAAKGGLIALTREMACKWARRGNSRECDCPRFFSARMTERLLAEHQAEFERRIPMGRIGRPGELKGVAVFLASDASSYIRGKLWLWMAARQWLEG